jgi:hypothetical protein
MPVQASRPGSAQQRVLVYDGPLVWKVKKFSNSWKGCHFAERGFWDSAARKCVSWQFLVHFCVKLEMDPNSGQWRKSTLYGDIGCNVFRQYDPLSSDRVPVANWRSRQAPVLTVEQVCHLLNAPLFDHQLRMACDSEYLGRVCSFAYNKVKCGSVCVARHPWLFNKTDQ